MMKKYCYIMVAVATLMLAAACTNKKKEKTREDRVEEFRSMLTASDTTQMLQLCDNAMELLKGKKIDEVIAMLNEYNDSTGEVRPLSDLTARRLKNQYSMFPVLDYTRRYYTFMLEGCNDVKYSVDFATPEQAGTSEPAQTMFMFNPVKVNGEWKLCVKTLDDDIDTSKY